MNRPRNDGCKNAQTKDEGLFMMLIIVEIMVSGYICGILVSYIVAH